MILGRIGGTAFTPRWANDAMPELFLRKLRHGAPLQAEDEALLSCLVQGARSYEARADIVPQGSAQRMLSLVLDGWACRYKLLANGRRQITALFLPGDLCEPFGVMPHVVDQGLAALTPAVVASVPLGAVQDAARRWPRIAEALWWDLLVAATLEREHIVSLGRRSASERLGHLFCELHVRLTMVGLADEDGFDLPITQSDLSDLLGLSAVHVNRSLQDLRQTGLLALRGRRLTLYDIDRLRELSLFEPAWFHPRRSDALP